MAVTYLDYGWLEFWGNDFFRQPYCLTLVRGRTPSDVLDRLEAGERSQVTGAEQTEELAHEAWEVHDGAGGYVAVTEVDGWALMFEAGGILGVTDDVIVPLSLGTELVSHFRNVNAVDHFYWLDNTELRVHFEPLFPFDREGTDAAALEPVLDEVGFDLRSISERGYWDNHIEAAFALAERLTGVHLTPSMLSDSEFLCGIAPLPGRRRTWT